MVTGNSVQASPGQSRGIGGGIRSSGALILEHTQVTANSAAWEGAGIQNTGSLTIRNSEVSDNVAVGDGAGIRSERGSILTIERSVISGNKATGYGTGGIASFGGMAAIDASTISGNTSVPNWTYGAGGWLALYEGNSAASSTITQNKAVNAPDRSEASSAGGVVSFDLRFSYYDYYTGDLTTFEYPASVSPRNTIIARNELDGIQDDVAGDFISGGHNLIGVLSDAATGFLAADLRGSAEFPLDPRLGPLAYNGGRTRSHLPVGRSPALDAGDNANATIADQRGFERISGDRIDIGAVEARSRPVPAGKEADILNVASTLPAWSDSLQHEAATDIQMKQSTRLDEPASIRTSSFESLSDLPAINLVMAEFQFIDRYVTDGQVFPELLRTDLLSINLSRLNRPDQT